jgi:hypothetical protein
MNLRRVESNMILNEALRSLIVGGALLLVPFGAFARAGECTEPKTGTKDVPIFSPPLANVVTGMGRLQFYSAPDARCALAGIFVIPKDKLIAYARTDDGWTSVMYVNLRTGNDVSGWVRSARLTQTGTMGPKQ